MIREELCADTISSDPESPPEATKLPESPNSSNHHNNNKKKKSNMKPPTIWGIEGYRALWE